VSAGVSARARGRFAGYAFVAPTAALLVGVALVPIALAVWLSLRRVIVVFHEDQWTGLSNYAFLLRDARFFSALGNTVYFAAVSVAVEIALGLPVALLLHRSFRGRGALRAAVLVPWAIPTVISARLWAWMWNPDYGVIVRVLGRLGARDVDVLGTPGYAIHAAILVDVWKSTPFVTLLLLAGIAGIPEEVYSAARVDGATRWRTFWAVTLPMLRPTLAVTLLFRGLDALRVFDVVYALTGGGPANTTETLSIYAYRTMINVGDFGYGSALAFATFLLVTALGAAYLATFGASAGKAER
jgi:multiple sugar transport system permease protein